MAGQNKSDDLPKGVMVFHVNTKNEECAVRVHDQYIQQHFSPEVRGALHDMVLELARCHAENGRDIYVTLTIASKNPQAVTAQRIKLDQDELVSACEPLVKQRCLQQLFFSNSDYEISGCSDPTPRKAISYFPNPLDKLRAERLGNQHLGSYDYRH